MIIQSSTCRWRGQRWRVEEAARWIDKIFELDGHVYAFDSTTIDLCLSVFEWAKFRKHKGGIITYCLVAILQQDMKLERSIYETLQILGISLTDKTHIRDLFDKKNINDVKVLYGSSEPNLFNF